MVALCRVSPDIFSFFNCLSHIMWMGDYKMNKRLFRALPETSGARVFALVLCTALFLCGCIVGIISAGFVSNTGGLSSYIAGLIPIKAGQVVSQPSFLSCFFNSIKYHICALFLAFSVLGVVCIPAMMAVRGFFLCFSVSVIVRLLGGAGIPLALSIFGIGALITIPCLFILSTQAFFTSTELMKTVFSRGGRSGPIYNGGFFKTAAFCFALPALSALADMLLVPKLVALAALHINLG